MNTVAQITIHPSQFPDAVRRDLLESLRSRQINHKFHYDSVKQTHRWLALHQAYAPSRTDPDCQRIYEAAFATAAAQHPALKAHVIGLGCGGGQKDTRLLRHLAALGRDLLYTPCDVSVPMVLVARAAALAVVPEENCLPLVCDLATADDLPEFFQTRRPAEVPRLITFFGMLPNFDPDAVMPRLAALLRPHDRLLLSANLAPGPDYAAGVERVLPQYDNELTRDWLMTLLLDLGVERGDGRLGFGIQEYPPGSGLRRIAALFRFERPRALLVEGERFDFAPGETLRVFFSYRYTPERVRRLLARHGLELREQWITDSEEEGVFLCRRA
ncbi:MAG: L-histidine N(alpha)-methyltransferase [Verrucomicrobiae bacterium]|nr:L-histidine N(alpha)-methyltransferase [Verrucomicrobiae bacterium]